MKSLWRHLQFNYRDGGVRRIFFKTFWRIGQWLWSEYTYLIYHLDVSHYDRAPRLPLCRRELRLNDLLKLGYFKATAFPELIRDRLSSGSICHGFLIDGELANVAWTTHGYIVLELNWHLPIPASLAIYDCFTLPEHRSKGVYAASLVILANLAHLQNVPTVVIAVDADNAISIRVIESVGFQPLCRIKRRRCLGWYFLRKSNFTLHGSGAQRIQGTATGC